MGISDVVVTAYHGDKGIDATGIYELGQGLEVRIAVQAKRQRRNVQRPVVQSLNGSLKPHQQGLIITTSDFGKGARDEAARDDKSLIWPSTASNSSSSSSPTTSAPGASRSSASSQPGLSSERDRVAQAARARGLAVRGCLFTSATRPSVTRAATFRPQRPMSALLLSRADLSDGEAGFLATVAA
jgi:Restriction endonuclease